MACVGQTVMQALHVPQCALCAGVCGKAMSKNISPKKNIDPPSRSSASVCLPRQPKPLRVANSTSSTGAESVKTRCPSGPVACAICPASVCRRARMTLW